MKFFLSLNIFFFGQKKNVFVQKMIKKKKYVYQTKNMEKNQEFITNEDNGRFSIFPIKYPKIWKAYKHHFNCMWTPEEIDYSIDKKEWDTLSTNEKFFLEHILAFFANSDSIVLENLVTNLCSTITIPEARSFYMFQAMMENVHSEVYSLLIENFISDEDKKMRLFNAMETVPCVAKKANWALKWIDGEKDEKDLGRKLFSFAIVEGLFFSGAFCAIFWFKEKKKLLNSLCKSNEWIARDEGLHCDFAILIYDYIQNKLTEGEAHEIMSEAVAIEEEFICESLPVDLIGMSKNDMKQYIKYVADRLLNSFNYSKIYHTTNPFPFMMKLNLDGKTNFFEQRVSEYSIAQNSNKNIFDSIDKLDESIF